MANAKQLVQMRQQLKKDIADLDHQVHELETFYIEDTKEAGNLLRGFENYISLKTSKIQSMAKKQKVQNYQRLFSLSSTISKTSGVLQQFFQKDPMIKMEDNAISKRARPRLGKTKSGGKHLMMREDNMQDESDSGDNELGDDSMDDSLGKSRQGNKKKKIAKSGLNRK